MVECGGCRWGAGPRPWWWWPSGAEGAEHELPGSLTPLSLVCPWENPACSTALAPSIFSAPERAPHPCSQFTEKKTELKAREVKSSDEGHTGSGSLVPVCANALPWLCLVRRQHRAGCGPEFPHVVPHSSPWTGYTAESETQGGAQGPPSPRESHGDQRFPLAAGRGRWGAAGCVSVSSGVGGGTGVVGVERRYQIQAK